MIRRSHKKSRFQVSDVADLCDKVDLLVRKGARCAVLNIYKLMFRQRIAVAAHRLGLYYLTGVLDGVSEPGRRKPARIISYNLARFYLYRANRWGVDEAAHDIVWLLFNELKRNRTVKTISKAKRQRIWIRVALEREHGSRRYALYEMLGWNYYWYGNESSRQQQAVRYWRVAAKGNDGTALGELAIAYGWGEGVRRSLSISMRYFKRVLEVDHSLLPTVIKNVGAICRDKRLSTHVLKRSGFLSFFRRLKESEHSV